MTGRIEISDEAVAAYRDGAGRWSGHCATITGCDDAVKAGIGGAVPYLTGAIINDLRSRLQETEAGALPPADREVAAVGDVQSYARLQRAFERRTIAAALPDILEYHRLSNSPVEDVGGWRGVCACLNWTSEPFPGGPTGDERRRVAHAGHIAAVVRDGAL